MASDRLAVGSTTFGFLYSGDIHASLRAIAEAGYQEVEIAGNEPHIVVTRATADEVRAIRRTLDVTGLRCVSFNPPEMNLISPNPEIRQICLDTYLASARILAELGGEVLMVVPGRYNGLIPMPEAQALDLFREQIGRLLDEVRRLDVTVALETTPFGFLASTDAIMTMVDELADPRVGIGLDVANTFPQEDVATSVHAADRHLKMVQFSGTWRDRWAHTSLDRGDLPVDDLREALEQIDYRGPCIYELVDGENPVPRIGAGLELLESQGWSR